MFGTRTCQSFKQIISSKLLKTKKSPNDKKDCRHRGFCRCGCVKKFGNKTVNTAVVKKALATSQPIFKLKSHKLLSQSWFLRKDKEPDSAGASFQDFLRRWRHQDDPSAFLFTKHSHGRLFFCFREVKTKLTDFCCPRTASWRTQRGLSESAAKLSPLPRVWTATKSTSESAETRPKKVLKWPSFLNDSYCSYFTMHILFLTRLIHIPNCWVLLM
jgi:hypothetical protein